MRRTVRLIVNTREAFLAILTMALAASSHAAGGRDAAGPVDLVVRHANVITVDTNQPLAQGFAIRAGKFVAVGSDDAMALLIGPGTGVRWPLCHFAVGNV